MDTCSTSIRKLAAYILMAALIILSIVAFSFQVTLAEGDDDEENGEQREITIEVVEDIPAAEIEEQAVPLADTPLTAAAGNMRNTVISWTIGAVILAYIVFLISGMRLRKNRRRMKAGNNETVSYKQSDRNLP